MNVSKLRTSTAIDKALGITAVSAAPKKNGKEYDGNLATQADKPAQSTPPTAELTAEDVSVYLNDMSAHSCNALDALIGDLGLLKEKLVADGNQIEQGIAEFATLNRSVMKLTEVVCDSVAHVQAPSLAG